MVSGVSRSGAEPNVISPTVEDAGAVPGNSRAAATLAAAATFQGVGEDVSAYGRVGVSISSSNATDGTLTMEVSHDNVNWGGPTRDFANTQIAEPHMWNIVEKYFRIKYVNGTTEANDLSIQVQYSNNADILLGHQLNGTLIDETEAVVVRSVAVGTDPNGSYMNEGVSGVDDGNSSSTNLTAGTSLVFTGTWKDVSSYSSISVHADGTASGTVNGTMQMQFSHDGSTVARNITIAEEDISDEPPRTLAVIAKYFRVIYTADSDLISFDIQTMLHNDPVSLISRLNQILEGTEDVQNVRAALVARFENGTYVNVPADGEGQLRVNLPKTAFGQLDVAERTAQIQSKYPHGVNTDIDQILLNNTANGSTVTSSNGVATVTASATATSFAQIRSLDTLRYGPGQGAEAMFTAAFTTGAANSVQHAGPGDDDEGFYFGYTGADYGVQHLSHGKLEFYTMTITAGADGGGGDFDVTLDGVAVTVTVSGGDTIAEVITAIKTAEQDFQNAANGWEVLVVGNTQVLFVSLVAEPAGGAFSFADTDSGVTATGPTQTIAGVVPTTVQVDQADWNVDNMDGSKSATNPSGILLSTSATPGSAAMDINNLIPYRVVFQFLGAGAIFYYIEQPTGGWQLVHVIERAGSSQLATLTDPTLHLNVIAETQSGYSGGAVSIKTASMAGFIQGKETKLGVRHSAEGTKSISTTTPNNVLTIYNKAIYNGNERNKIVVYPDHLTISYEGTKTATITLYLNPDQIDGTVAYTDVHAANSPMAYDTAGTTITGGDSTAVFTIAGTDSKEIDLKPLDVFLRPGDRWVFAAHRSSGSAADVHVGVTWLERN